MRVLRHENEAEELLHSFKLAGIEPGDSIELTGLTGESLELLTPAKGATTLSIALGSKLKAKLHKGKIKPTLTLALGDGTSVRQRAAL